MIKKLLAQAAHPLPAIEPPAPISIEGDTPVNQLENILSTIIGVMTVIGIIWVVFQILSAALAWIGSEGDKAKIAQARSQITQAIIGLVLIFCALSLISIIGWMFGINILNLSDLLGIE